MLSTAQSGACGESDLTQFAAAFGEGFDLGEGSSDASRHLTYVATRPRFFGRLELIEIRPGLHLTIADAGCADPIERRHVTGDVLKLHLRLSSTTTIGVDPDKPSEVREGSLACVTQPVNACKFERIAAGEHERAVTLSCSRELLAQLASRTSLKPPASVLAFADGRAVDFSCIAAPLPSSMAVLAKDVLTSRPKDPLATLLLEARALELLYLALEHLSGTDVHHSRPLRARDSDRVRDLCHILEGESGGQSLKDLSRLLAWNETQMMECFKQSTGMTISAYRQNVLMEQAYARLVESDISIAVLAFDCGYEHPGNFSTAFKRRYGLSPRELRAKRSTSAR